MNRNTVVTIVGLAIIIYLGHALFQDAPSHPDDKLQTDSDQEIYSEPRPDNSDTSDKVEKKPIVRQKVIRSRRLAAETEASLPSSATAMDDEQNQSYRLKTIDANERNKEGIDKKFIRGGIAFEGNLYRFKNLDVDQEITLDFAPLYVEYSGIVSKSFASDNGTYSVQIRLPNDSDNSFISLHYSSDGKHINGKMYTRQGDYEITYNGSLGYIISFEEMERQEQIELEESR